MEKEFVEYEIALELKELGFHDVSMAGFLYFGDLYIGYETGNGRTFNPDYHISAPLKQQAFRFFREKYGLIGWVEGKFKYKYCIESIIPTDEQLNRFPFRKYEEAELECLKKLIEIIKSR